MCRTTVAWGRPNPKASVELAQLRTIFSGLRTDAKLAEGDRGSSRKAIPFRPE